jgi:hypothetical protein
MPVTTTNNINTHLGFSCKECAWGLTIEEIDEWMQRFAVENAYPTFESFLNYLKN